MQTCGHGRTHGDCEICSLTRPILPADVAELQRENATIRSNFETLKGALRTSQVQNAELESTLRTEQQNIQAHRKEKETLRNENAELTRKLAEQQALAEALDDALDKFGEHKDGCTFAEPLPTGIGTWGCNCGLDNAKFGISGREELTKLLEEVKRQVAPEWGPIETAPKGLPGFLATDAEWSAIEWLVDHGDIDYFNVNSGNYTERKHWTLWIPLPDSPQPEPAKCKSCNGNDGDAPCAYPGEHKHGCLRNARISPQPEGVDKCHTEQ